MSALRGLIASLFATLFLLAGGCSVPSLNSLATPDTTVFEPSVLGEWVQKDKDGDGIHVRVGKSQNNTYSVVINPTDGPGAKPRDKDDGPADLRLSGALVKLGEHRFLDLTLDEEARKGLGDQYALLAIPVHQIVKISIEADQITIWNLDDKWLKALLRADAAALGHSMVDGESPVITAPTGALQKFIAAHAGDEKAWTEPQVYLRAKPAPKPDVKKP